MVLRCKKLGKKYVTKKVTQIGCFLDMKALRLTWSSFQLVSQMFFNTINFVNCTLISCQIHNLFSLFPFLYPGLFWLFILSWSSFQLLSQCVLKNFLILWQYFKNNFLSNNLLFLSFTALCWRKKCFVLTIRQK